jgi:hypothetical protein
VLTFLAGLLINLTSRAQNLDSTLSGLFLKAKLNTDLVTYYKSNSTLKYQLRSGYPEYPARFSGAAQCDNHEYHFVRHPYVNIQLTDGYIAVHMLKTATSNKTVGLSIRFESSDKRSMDSLFKAMDDLLIDLAESRKTTHYPLVDESEYLLPEEKIKRILIYRNKGTWSMKLTTWVVDIVIPMETDIPAPAK